MQRLTLARVAQNKPLVKTNLDYDFLLHFNILNKSVIELHSLDHMQPCK